MADRPLCPKCGKPLAVTTSRVDGFLRVRYLGCRACRSHTGQPPQIITLSDSSRTKAANRT